MDILGAFSAGSTLSLIIGLLGTAITFKLIKSILKLRTVVPTNMVHIVQSKKGATSYGRGRKDGNIYYVWPSWIPVIGVTVSQLPETNFAVHLVDYEAYDSQRLPFLVDVTAFFRVSDSSLAAQRIATFQDLKEQLQTIVQGAVRRVLAIDTLEQIMEARGSLGKAFTDEVDAQLQEWGVVTVKSIEFMDIRDTRSTSVISDIMKKEMSRIDRESRVAIAENEKLAETAEIEKDREIELREQDMKQQVGTRTAEQERIVGIEREKSLQDIQQAAKITAERAMEVKKVQEVKAAEIAKETAVIKAQQQAEVQIVEAEAERKAIELKAEADLTATVKSAEGIAAKGKAEAEAHEKMLMAPVTAQITLAEKIGQDQGYQNYLINVEQVKANQVVGVEMAKAMAEAKMTIVASGSGVQDGAASLMDTFGAKLGANLVGFLETSTASARGRDLVNKVVNPET